MVTSSTNSVLSVKVMWVVEGLYYVLYTYLNCQNFLSYKETVNLIYSFHLDALALSETSLDNSVPDDEIVGFLCFAKIEITMLVVLLF